jgi:hypothetical protein
VSVRQPSVRTSGGVVIGRTTPLPRTAAEIAATTVGFVESDWSRSEAAQQASACACVIMRFELDSAERSLCIGQSASAQHAIRASGVAAQPAQTATFPATKPRPKTMAATRWTRSTTSRMRDRRRPCQQIPVGTYNRRVRHFAAALMLVVFAALNAIDGICCPDGCTHEEQASSTPSSPRGGEGICVLCVGGLSRPAPEALLPGVPVVSVVARVSATNRDDVPADPPEHPPRS